MPCRVYTASGLRRDWAKFLELDRGTAARIATALDKQFMANERKLFASEGASGGAPWRPLSLAYAMRKAGWRRGRQDQRRAIRQGRRVISGVFGSLPRLGSNKILQLTGQMRQSFTAPGWEHIRRLVRLPGIWRVQLGSHNDLARHHKTGGPKLPRRDPIQHTSAQLGQYNRLVAEIALPVLKAKFRALSARRPTVR